ncbi:MAG: HlyD family efflux transporter periplasmic adaptor subunit [Patescibacteria group bacterium]|jgi:HlyD family secretion protein
MLRIISWIKSLSLKKKILLVLTLAVIIIGAFFVLKKKPAAEYTTAKAALGTLKQTVSETGTVEAPEDLNLSFLASGRLNKILVKEGERVFGGQALAELDYGALSIKKKEAQASLDSANASLDKLISGSTGSEIRVARANVNQAKASYNAAVVDLEKTKNTTAENNRQAQKKVSDLTSSAPTDVTTYEQSVIQAKTVLDNTRSSYETALKNYRADALSAVEDSIFDGQTALDKIDAILQDTDKMANFSVKDASFIAKTKDGYTDAGVKKNTANTDLSAGKSSNRDADIKTASNSAITFLNAVLKALDYCFKGLEKSLATSDYSQATLDADKTLISTQISTITASISSLQTAGQNLNTGILNYDTKVREAEEDLAQAQASLDNAALGAQNSLDSTKLTGEQSLAAAESKVETALKAYDSAQASLDKVLAGSNNFDIRAAQAGFAQAEANLESINRQIEDSVIIAPVSGTVTKIAYQIGETVQAASTAISMIGDNDFNIKIDISEIDVSKISAGNECEITFDSFGAEKKFEGIVYFIDTAPTIIQDVVYYKVKVKLKGTDVMDELTATSTAGAVAIGATSTAPLLEGSSEAGEDLENPAETAENASAAKAEAEMTEEYSRIKPGMTANVDIFAAKKDGVLIMPLRAVVDKNGSGKYVRVMDGKTPKEVPVEIGLKGDEGMVEVISGVKEGDEVVTFVKENAK